MKRYAPLLSFGLLYACTGVEYSKPTRLSAEIVADPGEINFGDITKLYSVSSSVEIVNAGSGSLEIYGAELKVNERYIDTFQIDGIDDLETIPSGGSANLEVTFNPMEYTNYTARLDIESNSGFDYEDRGEESEWDAAEFHFLEIPILGSGVKGSTPDISVPEALDFTDPDDGGDVAPGDEVTRTLTIQNTGDGTLEITRASIPSGPFSLVYELEGRSIAQGSEFSAPIIYAPTEDDAGSTSITIESTDPDESSVSVRLIGNGNYERPIAVIDCEALDNNTPPRTVTLNPLGSDDPEDVLDLHPLTYEWELIESPPISRTSIRNPTEQFPELFLDVAGAYEVGLTVTDWNGIRSSQETCEVMIEPDQKQLYVAMSWDTSNSDLDLHLVPEDEEMWGCNDASWCNPDADWMDDGEGWGDPVYALDNTSGYGPENINVKNPGPYRYNVIVHYWADRGGGESVVNMSVYIRGDEWDVDPARLTSGQRWNVGHIQMYEDEEGNLSGVFVPSGTEPYSEGGSCDDEC